jgi:TolA-binding protein
LGSYLWKEESEANEVESSKEGSYIMTTKKKESTSGGLLENLQGDIDQLIKLDKKTQKQMNLHLETLEDILQRLTVLEAHAESKDATLKSMDEKLQNRDELIRMLREHTLRLVKEKENLLLHLGMKRQSELNNQEDVQT